MSKALFLGDNYYTWLGMKHILRGTPFYVDFTFCPSSALPFSVSFPGENDYIFIQPGHAEILKYAGIIRHLSAQSTFTLFVLTDSETFSVFQTVCGRKMHCLNPAQSLDALYRQVIRLLNSKADTVRPLDNAITASEFNVMMMFARGWSLSRIANAAHRSEKTIGNYKSNIAKKLGHSNAHLKYIFSHYR